MTPMEFISKWRNTRLTERQGAQSFFNDICELVGHPTPAEYGDSEKFTFEKPVPGGFADAYLDGHFGWEFKRYDGQLPEALNQLLRYSVYLRTPPLLIVSSFRTIRIRTNFPGMETVVHEIPLLGLADAENLRILRCAFFEPDELRPERSVDTVTRETTDLFHAVVAEMEEHTENPETLARYLNQLVFCLYADAAGLLPRNIFTVLVQDYYGNPKEFAEVVRGLFEKMAEGGRFGIARIPYFDGNLFDHEDIVELSHGALLRLAEATQKNWQDIEPSIFGTLFERALDASKRSQLGAHYTSAEDIMLVVDPVVMAPLRREWDAAQLEVDNLLSEEDRDGAQVRLEQFRQRLFEVTVLDPACGSGNFLYLALRSLLDLEKEVIAFAAARSLSDLKPRVKPDQMLGLEINPYAAAIARTALWIGYIQWHQANGFDYTDRPILTPLNTISQTDAILDLSDPDNPKETEWPAAEFIIGNPPFLGHFPFRESLGDTYVEAVYATYGDRIPNSSDLCCYWFEKARGQIEKGHSQRAGLLATQAIRFQSNRPVLERIKDSGDIFHALSDKDWVLDGAMVHTSIICFDDGSETVRFLDGDAVAEINSDLTYGADVTRAARLTENQDFSFMGDIKVGRFEISNDVAQKMLRQPNPHGKPNSDVVKRWMVGRDINQVSRNMWIIDFGVTMSETDAALYEAPFEYVAANVKPDRDNNRDAKFREYWWLHGRPRIKMRQALEGLPRYIGTSMVSRHRLFSYIDGDVLPDATIIVFARDDDYFFGVLHSRIHEIWARAMGTQLREAQSGIRYTPTTCFETFPFPEPTEEQREAIGAAAGELNQMRENWLDAPGLKASELKRRTLTNLYNQRPTWLDNAHRKLDAAVADAYGWPADLGEQEVLERLLELNSNRRWDELLASPESDELLERWAEETLADIRAGRVEPLNLEDL